MSLVSPAGNSAEKVDLMYKPRHSHYDEVYTADGELRAHWQYPIEALQALGVDGLSERQHKARRILRDDGATYNAYSKPKISQIWNLDPLPFVLASEEWESVENALRERAELLNLLLDDIYGERLLIRHKIIPPAALFSHPDFMRACDGVKLPGDQQLIFHAADLVRSGNGDWMVIGDRAQSPSGSGYALENRTVLTRVMPSLFRDAHVHRLSLFFRNIRHALATLSTTTDLPRIVFLTPGAFNEAYFEHAYLANYLGYPLVQGSDLSVRDGNVWLKALDGLRKVDVIIRRVDDDFCDPVAFRNDSNLGVPGLLEVARAGRVAIANPLGSGILESPVLAKYLPAAAKFFLGRDLRLNSVPTWWCGEKDDLAYVKANFNKLLIRRTSRSAGQHSLFVSSLTAEKQKSLMAEILANPMDFVAQEAVQPSQAPVLTNDQLVSRPVVMRSFSVATGSSYSVMPGGLTRVGSKPDSLHITSQTGALSKDTWILASEPESLLSLRNTDDIMRDAQIHDTDLPSRVVENLYWFGRYAERAESGLRLLRTVFEQLNGIEPLPPESYICLFKAVTDVTATKPGFFSPSADFSAPETELLDVITNTNRSGSIAASLHAMLHSSDGVKELLSSDMHRLSTDIRDGLDQLSVALRDGLHSAPEEALDPIVTTLLALSGLSQESMVRSRAWRFMEIGRRLERSLQTIKLLRALLVDPVSPNDPSLMLRPTLASLESMITYRRRYQGKFDVANGLELLLMDKHNPRSVLFQLESLRENLDLLSNESHKHSLGEESRCVLKASNALLLAELDSLAIIDSETDRREGLDALLDNLVESLESASVAVSNRYFDHTGGPQPLAFSNLADKEPAIDSPAHASRQSQVQLQRQQQAVVETTPRNSSATDILP